MRTVLSPLVLTVVASFMACSAPDAGVDEDGPVVVPAPGAVTPADIGLPPPPVEQVFQPTQVSVGRLHTCVLLLDGQLACWGTNYHGRLGIGTTTGARNPKPLRSQAALTGFHQVSAGESHTCVIRGDNRLVSCWGLNSYGASNPVQPDGDPPTSGCPLSTGCSTPSTIPNVTNARHLAAGYDHTCAWAQGGAGGSNTPGAICWGRSNTNLMGAGGGGGWPVRTYYHSTSGIDAGERFSCIHVTWDNRVWCFGKFPAANGGWTETSGSGIEIGANGSEISTVTVGKSHLCILRLGHAFCQGESLSGQTGIVTTSQSPHTTTLHDVVAGATAIAAGERHTCAIIAGGRVKCWGDNDRGQLGVGESYDLSAIPVTAALPSSQVATTIAAGGDTTCVITESRRLYCWGDNTYGQVGNDSADTMVPAPSRVTW